MSNSKGFTLIELIIVMVIVGVLTAIALPNYFTFINQGASNNALNNLQAIYNGQQSYYNTKNAYCLNTSAAPCDSLADIITNLPLNITDSNFTYICVTDLSGFKCTAASPLVTLTLINNPLILVGAAGCGNSSGASCNPICAPAGNNCPTT
jgi:prepilin-type N-terminal cleavage/methylation domain-containing protein